MICILFDTITLTLTGYYINLFLFYMNYLPLNKFIPSLVLLFILNNDYILILTYLLMYIINYTISKYVNYNFLFSISMYTFFYIIIKDIDSSFFLNLILVILIYFSKYNFTGEIYEFKRVSKKFI